MTVADTTARVCTCVHSMRSHRNGYGRCLSEGCGCLVGPAPQLRPARQRTPGKPSERSRLEALLLRRIELAGLPLPELEYRFARSEGRMFRADGFYPPDILIEVEGGIWARDAGRHNRGSGFEQDATKYNLAALLGFRVFRFTQRLIESGEAVATIRRALGSDKIRSSNEQGAATLATSGSAATKGVELRCR